MPSQIFDDGYGMYEVPSGERLVFKGGEGADASYNLPSSFDRASSLSQRGRRSVMGSADRFTSAGSYLKNSSAPGPGSYTVNPTAKPSSRYGVLGPELQRDQDRLKFEGVGEGADAIYSTQSAFDNKTPNKSGGGFGASKRFGKVDSYVSGSYSDAPGPGAYTASPGVKGDINGVRKNGPAPPQNGGNRLNFAPSSGMGESPGPVYKVESSFKSADMKMRNSASSFGKSDRFHSPGSYLKNTENPGPGSYSAPSHRMRPQSASHGGRHSFRERSVDFGPAGEGADPAYTVQSSFDKAAERGSKPSSSFGTTSRFDKHGSYAAKSSSSEPGPGAYASPIQNHFQKFSVSTGAPRPTSSKGRVDFGPAGEGVGAIYEVKSSFDASGTLKRGPTSCFGSSNRFEGQGAYAKPTASPGPGAYTNREEVLKRSAPKATFASPRMRPPGWHNRPRSASALNSSSNSYLR